jgi:hypothetical protein
MILRALGIELQVGRHRARVNRNDHLVNGICVFMVSEG